MLQVTNLLLVICFCVSTVSFSQAQTNNWQTVETIGTPTARHEASLVAFKDKLYLIGGRRVNPVDVYDPSTNTWTAKSKTPLELHHFQAVVVGDAIYLIGAMSGQFPKEKPLEKIVVYYPEKDKFDFVHTIPPQRRRGGAGAAVHNGKIYIVGGITNGHINGCQPWLDEYDPVTGKWTPLQDAPHSRDHFAAVVMDGRLFATGGRRTSHETKQLFELTIGKCDVFDFEKKQWLPTSNCPSLPTLRAGNMAIAVGDELLVGGGESMTQVKAHREVEAFNTSTNSWRSLPSLNRGRHGSGFAIVGDYLYTASGCGNRGGNPELTSVERLKLSVNIAKENMQSTNEKQELDPSNNSPITKWHTKSLSFAGPNTSESAEPNPFTDYRLLVKFSHQPSGRQYSIRGFYAADGDAANTSSTSGNIWKVRFSPNQVGQWSYTASLSQGDQIAVSDDPDFGTAIPLDNAKGQFSVSPTQRAQADFRSRGKIVADGRYFRFADLGKRWIKGGADSPENLLAFVDFDGTYRMDAADREGEAKTDKEIHRFPTHVADWKKGDPTWAGPSGQRRGKAIIGAMNYLASKRMNACYFLTLNIKGDGKDVWPYATPEDFTRFDCSKLDQWEMVFDHMQRSGILMHVVTQETENETMLDAGDTGPLRKLYYRELIARFAHHPALVWNLGEENGPAEWTPDGQTPTQRLAMANYLSQSDPYDHPIVMHTHADTWSKKKLLTPLLGSRSINGLSFQVDKRELVHDELKKWLAKSKEAGKQWLICMDEIGMWHTGVLPDSQDPDHDSLRRYVLWGSLLAGGAGVEWYFGAKHPHNDLTSEDWRQRDQIWTLTAHALSFFEAHLPYWEMQSADELTSNQKAYCFAKPGDVYAIYLPKGESTSIDLKSCTGSFSVHWYDPFKGGPLLRGSVQVVDGAEIQELGNPPTQTKVESNPQDWVVLVRKKRGDSK